MEGHFADIVGPLQALQEWRWRDFQTWIWLKEFVTDTSFLC